MKNAAPKSDAAFPIVDRAGSERVQLREPLLLFLLA
jgi:hypothetical protein